MNQDQPHRRDERKRSRPKRKRRWSRRWRLTIRQALAISLLIHGLVLLIRFDETGFGFAAGSPKGGPPPLVAERRFQVPDIRIVLAPPWSEALLGSADGVYNRRGPEALASEGIAAIDVVMEPGEALFIPAGWWHDVRALDVSVSLAINAFARANVYGWYAPGSVR